MFFEDSKASLSPANSFELKATRARLREITNSEISCPLYSEDDCHRFTCIQRDDIAHCRFAAHVYFVFEVGYLPPEKGNGNDRCFLQ